MEAQQGLLDDIESQHLHDELDQLREEIDYYTEELEERNNIEKIWKEIGAKQYWAGTVGVNVFRDKQGMSKILNSARLKPLGSEVSSKEFFAYAEQCGAEMLDLKANSEKLLHG